MTARQEETYGFGSLTRRHRLLLFRKPYRLAPTKAAQTDGYASQFTLRDWLVLPISKEFCDGEGRFFYLPTSFLFHLHFLDLFCYSGAGSACYSAFP